MININYTYMYGGINTECLKLQVTAIHSENYKKLFQILT